MILLKKSNPWVAVRGAWRAKAEIVQIVQRGFEHRATKQCAQGMDF